MRRTSKRLSQKEPLRKLLIPKATIKKESRLNGLTPEEVREWWKVQSRNRGREKLRGFTVHMVEQMREAQGGCCAICSRKMRTDNCKAMDGEQADHDHETGTPRALLCRACNQALGFYEKWQKPAGLVIQVYDDYLKGFAEVNEWEHDRDMMV